MTTPATTTRRRLTAEPTSEAITETSTGSSTGDSAERRPRSHRDPVTTAGADAIDGADLPHHPASRRRISLRVAAGGPVDSGHRRPGVIPGFPLGREAERDVAPCCSRWRPTLWAGIGAADVGVAGAVALLTLIGLGMSVADNFPFLAVDHDAQPLLPAWRAVLEAVAEAAPLVFRRVAPLRVFLLVAGASLLDEALNRHPEPLPLAVLVALYTLAVMRRPRVAVLAAAGYLAALALDAATAWTDVTDDQLYVDLLAVAGTVTLGCWLFLDRARTGAAEQRTREVTRTVEATMQAAVDRERARIAREMHDVLGHQLSLIVAQASTTRRVFADRRRPRRRRSAPSRSVGRDALSGLRRVVGLLRADRGRPPGVDGLDALVGQLGRAGLPAQLVVHGTQRPLAAEVELTAFRIVQEALTNSLRHSGRSGVTITLTYGENALDIDVTDAGPPGPPSRSHPRARPRTAQHIPGSGWSGCTSGSSCSAAAWPPAPSGAAASGCGPGCRWSPLRGGGTRHDDPGDRRRRSAADAGGPPGVPRRRARPHGRRRGRGRRDRGRVWPSGCGRTSRSCDVRMPVDRRDGGDPPDRRPGRRAAHPGRAHDDVRRRRAHHRRAARRRQRLPGQGRDARRAARRRARGRRGQAQLSPLGDPTPAGPARVVAPARVGGRRRTTASPTSPRASGRCSSSRRAACPTARSPARWTSRPAA